MQLLVLEPETRPYYQTVRDRLNARFEEIKRGDPRGYRDQFESRIDTICAELAQELGGHFTYREGRQHTLIFVFPPTTPDWAEQHLDKHPELWS